jgi:hypothetical protein
MFAVFACKVLMLASVRTFKDASAPSIKIEEFAKNPPLVLSVRLLATAIKDDVAVNHSVKVFAVVN